MRTFHMQTSIASALAKLLPAAALAVYFFWTKHPLPALIAAVWAVVVVDRLVNTSYVFDRTNNLVVKNGRLAKERHYPLSEIERAEVVQRQTLALWKPTQSVILSLQGGKELLIAPFPARDFCEYFRRHKEQTRPKE